MHPNRKKLQDEMAKWQDDFEKRLTDCIGKRKLRSKNVISIDDLSKEEMDLIFDCTKLFKEFIVKPDRKMGLLKGTSQVNFFFEDSTRTRSSFELAGKHLGIDTINISKGGSSMDKKGETLNDTARTLDKMHADVIILRHSKAGTPQMIADQIKAAVISGGDGWHEHPTQALLDLYTILDKKGKISGNKVVIVGDIKHSRVAGSLIRALNKYDIEPRIAGPPTLIPFGLEKVFKCKVFYSLEEAIKGVDVIYALRIQLERAAGAEIPTVREYSKTYCINPARLAMAKPDAIVMHPGPINREVDLRTEVMDGPQSAVEDQVENGFACRLALLYLLLGGDRR
ncbi:MAG: aspartate carbamoyltransferase catalytic subunit [Candidatus Diapherotrites archaeon]|nr:aspartate carbamoyltransferase catalytic subunit [Candidatus Diapherotrites archaeon]